MVRRVGGIDDDDIFGIDASEAHLVGGITLGGPVPPVVDAVQDALLLEVVQEFLDILVAELFSLLEGEFEGSALQVVEQDKEVVGIDAAVFR